MVDYFKKEFQKKYKKDISGNKRVMRRLRIFCERVKRIFFLSYQVNIEIDFFYEGIDFYELFSRVKFEKENGDFFRVILIFVEKVLKDVKLIKEKIDEIVLVGGFIRIFKI